MGTVEGTVVGSDDGCAVGTVLGGVVGNDDGDAVGAAVGAIDGMPTQQPHANVPHKPAS